MNEEIDKEGEEQHSAKMDPSDLAILRKAYGNSVSWYLNNRNVVSKKAVSGAYVISTRGCFDTCLELMFNRAELGEATSVAPMTNEETPSSPVQPGNVKHTVHNASKRSIGKSKNVVARQTKIQGLSVATKLKIYFRPPKDRKFKVERKTPPFNFSRITKRRSIHQFKGAELYEQMMTTTIGTEEMSGYTACLKKICAILTEFQRRHSKFQYFTVLQKILKKKGGTKSNDTLEITLKQYREFVYNVFAFVIPNSFFGCHKNAKILRKALKEYYLSQYKTPICLKPYIYSLNMSCISWLYPIKNMNTRWSVLAKTVKWFFESFFVPMIKALCHQQKQLYNEKRIMVSAEKWKRFQHDYIDRQLSEGRIAKVNPEDDCRMNDIPSGKIILYAKSMGVRPIYRLRYNNYQRKELYVLRVLLQQLYLQRYEFVSFEKLHSTWLTYVTANEENANRKVNLATCDVFDAFGSIIQEKLFDIVNGMINEIPDEILPLKWYELILPTEKKRKPEIKYARWFSCCSETPCLQNSSLVGASIKAGHEIVYVNKEYIRAKLAAYIFEQTFQFKRQHYELRKGILQGSMLSSILSDIYYQHMTVQEFGIFMQSGTILRYVDDYIYITRNEDSAKRFLEMIKKGVPEYNCHFQKCKVQTNVESWVGKKSEWVSYLRFKLNGGTMEVRPDYETPDFQYFKWMQYVARKNSLQMFAIQSADMVCLKLKDMVLDPKINSLSGLCTSAGLAAERIAIRTVILLSTIFEDAAQYKDSIMYEIRVIVNKLGKFFRRHLAASDRAKWPTFRNSILITIWQSFFRVFARNSKLHKLFGKDIKRMIQNRILL